MCSSDIFLGVLAILFPPLPVWVKTGICSADSIINILLCMLGFIPGLIHAWYIIAKFPDPAYDYERIQQANPEDGRTTYVIVRDGRASQQQPPKQAQPSYGTTSNNNASSGSSGGGEGPAPVKPKVPGPGPQGAEGGEGSSANPPPTYAAAVAGDHKIQNHE